MANLGMCPHRNACRHRLSSQIYSFTWKHISLKGVFLQYFSCSKYKSRGVNNKLPPTNWGAPGKNLKTSYWSTNDCGSALISSSFQESFCRTLEMFCGNWWTSNFSVRLRGKHLVIYSTNNDVLVHCIINCFCYFPNDFRFDWIRNSGHIQIL